MRPAILRLLVRFTPSLAGLAALFMFAGLWLRGDHLTYYRLLFLWGVIPVRLPFLDVAGSLAAWDCARQGLDVIVSDPCDVLNRPYNYSPFWMTIDWIPLGLADRFAVGFGLGVAFLLSLGALPPPRSSPEMMVRLASVLSTVVVFAIERANPDLLIFLLVLLALSMLQGTFVSRLLAYGVIFTAGAIKYYPFVLLSLIAREPVRRFVPILAAAITALFVFYDIYHAQIREGLPSIATGSPSGDMFGSKNLLSGMFLVSKHLTGSKLFAVTAATLARLLVIMASIVFACKLWNRSHISAAISRLDEHRRLALISGALILSGCFLSGQNVGYRGIFLLLILPGLFALGRDEAAGALTRVAKWAVYIIPVLMWTEALRFWIHAAITGNYRFPSVDDTADFFYTFLSVEDQPVDFFLWIMRELGWWFLISLCLTMAMGFFANLPAAYWAWRKMPLRRGT